MSGSSTHRSSAANPDDDTQAKDGYSIGVAELFNGWSLAGKFEDLLLIAAPKSLGELRKHWNKGLQAKLIGDIDKDPIGQPTDEIASAFAKA